MRQALAAVLMVALTLGGVGRGISVAASAAVQGSAVAGLNLPICHSGTEAPSDRHAPVQHDCCDDCALGAPIIVPQAPPIPLLTSVGHAMASNTVVTWIVRLSRARSPRQSQGPPAA